MEFKRYIIEWADKHSDLLGIVVLFFVFVLFSPLFIYLFKTYYEEEEPEYDHITELYLKEVDLCEIITNRNIAVWKNSENRKLYFICDLDSSQLVRLYNKPFSYEIPDSYINDTIIVQDSKQALKYEHNKLIKNKLYKYYLAQKHEIDKEYKKLKQKSSVYNDDRLDSISHMMNELFLLTAKPEGDLLLYSNKATLLISSIRWEIVVRGKNMRINDYKALRLVEKN